MSDRCQNPTECTAQPPQISAFFGSVRSKKSVAAKAFKTVHCTICGTLLLQKSGPAGSLDVPGRCDVFPIFLRIPLRHQEGIVPATSARIFPADGGAGGVNRALP